MPPRLWCLAPRSLRLLTTPRTASHSVGVVVSASTSTPRLYATISGAAATLKLPDDYVPPTQPPSARPPDKRKSQLLRSYTSLLRSTPLMLIFQHNNLTAFEWAAVRRELRLALQNVAPAPVPADNGSQQSPVDLASRIKIEIVRTSMLDVATRIVELERLTGSTDNVGEEVASAATGKKVYNHDLSKKVWKRVDAAMRDNTLAQTRYSELSALLTGPIAIVAFPTISPAHLTEVLKVLAPSPPAFPAPTRRKNPGYYDPAAQTGLQKLLLVGGRVEGKVFDTDGVKWVGGIQGGLEGLRAQLVHLLQSAGMGLAGALEGASKSLWFTMENRKAMLEEEQKGPAEGEQKGPEGEQKEGSG